MIVNELVISRTVKLTVPAFGELTEKVVWPFGADILTGEEDPLMVKPESLVVWVIVKLSVVETSFLLQSLMLTVNDTEEPVFVDTADAGSTSEYQKLAVPGPVVQFGFPELFPEKVTVGL